MDSPILEKLFQAEMQNPPWLYLEYFTIGFRFNAVQIGEVREASAQIPNDSDFLVREINRSAFNGGEFVENPDLLMDLVDSGSGRLFNTNIRPHMVSVTGTGQRPFILPEPRVIAGGNALSVTIENLSGAEISRVHLTFVGTKIFFRNGRTLLDVIPERQ